MNYYIDFDNTLYETAKLTSLMIAAIGNKIGDLTGLEKDPIIQDAKDNFNSTLDNIFTHAEKMGKKYNVDSELVVNAVNEVLSNGKEIVFEDAIRFLERLKEKGHKIHILTYVQPINMEYQLKKLMGSTIANYFDGIIITSKYKFLLDIDYTNGIFIDDDPRDLNGLFEKNPIKVIRIRKPNNKRSKIDIDNKEIEEYVSFDEIVIE
ncbi:MAG: HAD hydrolase-like protein [Clostridia bacterium]|nr:HAD hydrolase-like protein [Clostridia bacterium]